MAVDLRALARLARETYGAGAAAEAGFWRSVRTLAKTDLGAYGLWVHGHEAPVFRKAADARHLHVMRGVMETHGKALIVTPPEHFKSTQVQWRLEMWLGQETEAHFSNPDHPAPTAILAMNAAPQSYRRCRVIAATLEANPRYRELFPNVAPDKGWGWSSTQLYLERRVPHPDPSLLPVGVAGPIQGMRARFGVVDDATDQQDARSPKVLQDQIDWRLGVYSDRLAEDAVEIDVMTRWSRGDLYSVLSKDPDRGVLVMPALGFWREHPEYGVDEDALWPEVWPLSRLAVKKREKMLSGDGGLWELTYMCNPEKAEGRLIRREWFRYGLPLDGPVVAVSVGGEGAVVGA